MVNRVWASSFLATVWKELRNVETTHWVLRIYVLTKLYRLAYSRPLSCIGFRINLSFLEPFPFLGRWRHVYKYFTDDEGMTTS